VSVIYTSKIGSFRIYHGVVNQKDQMLSLVQSRLVDAGYQLISRGEKGFTAITTGGRFQVETSVEQEDDNIIVNFLVGARGLYRYFPYFLLIPWVLFVLFLIPLSWILPDLLFWPSPWAPILIFSSLVFIFVIPVLVLKLRWNKTQRFLERSIEDAVSTLGWKPGETWKKKRFLESTM
jgi:hypothetical protein